MTFLISCLDCRIRFKTAERNIVLGKRNKTAVFSSYAASVIALAALIVNCISATCVSEVDRDLPTSAAKPATQVTQDSTEGRALKPDQQASRKAKRNDARMLQRLKAATVLIKTTVRAGGQTGSGFLITKKNGMGFIITNSHVIAPRNGTLRQVECVFHSGTPNEFTVPAHVRGDDEKLDVAILAVPDDSLPEPLDLGDRVAVHERQSVFLSGFPFGVEMVASKRNPAITVSKRVISSIRRDVYKNVAAIQISGAINPSITGGPIVTEDGTLIGVAVSKPRQAERAFVIPVPILKDMLFRRVLRVSRQVSSSRSTCYLTVDFVDPMLNIESAAIAVFSDDLQTKSKPQPSGRWQRASEKAKEEKLTMQNRRATFKLKAKN